VAEDINKHTAPAKHKPAPRWVLPTCPRCGGAELLEGETIYVNGKLVKLTPDVCRRCQPLP